MHLTRYQNTSTPQARGELHPLMGVRHPELMVQPAVLPVCRNTGRDRVWPADQLQPGWQFAVIPVGIIAAVAADELERVGVAAFRPSTVRAGWRRRTSVQPSTRCPLVAMAA